VSRPCPERLLLFEKHLNIDVLIQFYVEVQRGNMIFEALYVIKVRNVDLKTGLNLLESLSNVFVLSSIKIHNRGDSGV
jgi:hypothetical protein